MKTRITKAEWYGDGRLQELLTVSQGYKERRMDLLDTPRLNRNHQPQPWAGIMAEGFKMKSNSRRIEELHRIQTKATAPHLFEEIPGNRPILKDKCNQCGADRDAPIHTAPACDHCNDTRKIDGEACGWCVDVAYTAPKPTGETIDLTPESLKTPEGAARVSKALDDWNNARVEFANAASRFISRHGDEIRSMLRRLNEDSAYSDCEELEELNEAFTATQDGFLRAMANHPPR